MTRNNWGDLVLSKEEYELLKSVLEEHEVNLNWSATDGKTFKCYVRNPWKTAGQGWGSDLVKKEAAVFFERGF